jgi:hypothetical protein
VRSQTAAIRSEGVCASQSVSGGSTAPDRMIRLVTTRSGSFAIVTPEAYHETTAAPTRGGPRNQVAAAPRLRRHGSRLAVSRTVVHAVTREIEMKVILVERVERRRDDDGKDVLIVEAVRKDVEEAGFGRLRLSFEATEAPLDRSSRWRRVARPRSRCSGRRRRAAATRPSPGPPGRRRLGVDID